ncbi:MAG: 50S ribosomal protein L13 [Patescibacteria group bacterium]
MEQTQIKRDVYQIDAEGKVLGRFATDIAMHLMGKHKPDFQAHIDSGDIVEVVNVEKLKITGKKMEQKKYFHHSGYPGGIKEDVLADVMAKDPAKVLQMAVSRMLPKNKHRKERLKRLKIS